MNELTETPLEEGQIDFKSYLSPKKTQDLSETRVNYTTSDLYKKRLHERDEAVFYSSVGLASTVGVSKFLYDKVDSSPELLENFNKLPGTNLLNERLSNTFDPSGSNIDPTFAAKRPLSNSLQSMLLAVEEASPLHIMKTLQLSSFNTLFVEIIDQENKERHIKTSSIQAYKDYYKNLILNSSGHDLTDLDVKNGFILKNDKLYQALPDGTTGKELLGYARAINTNLEIGSQDSPNRVFQKFANVQGGKSIPLSQLKEEPIAIVGAASKSVLQKDWIRAYARFSTEIGFKVLDNPLGFIEEIVKAGGTEKNAVVDSKLYQGIKNKSKALSLGTNGAYDLSVREGVKKMAKNIAVKSTALYLGYNGANAFLDNLTPEDSTWHKGVLAGLSGTYANARIGAAEVWSDKFQGYKAAQEEAAPESTSLVTLLALPLAGAMGGANLAYFERMKDNKTLGITGSSAKHTNEKLVGGIAGDVLDKIGMNKVAGTTLKRYSKVGSLAGAALTLPYLPGALIGTSSEELRAEYAGDKEVAVRANRGWLMGGESIKGGKIKYHRKSLIAENVKDAKTKALYESTDEKRALDPIYSPFRYLQNPYEFEEKHKDDMPYPVWGMDVTYGSFLGKAYQGTIGEVIKPTVINPELEKITSGVSGHSKLGLLKKLVAFGGDDYSSPQQASTVQGVDVSNDLSGDTFSVPMIESTSVKSLISDNLMAPAASPMNKPMERSSAQAYSALSDFTGLKGFTSNLTLNGLHLSPEDQLAPDLAVSGSAITAKDSYQDMQLGDALGAGEFIRRLIPQSAGTNRETINPMRNLAAPSWLPNDETRFHTDFSRGNYYEAHEKGETLLPGKGYAELTPELKDLDPKDYPLAYRYKILQNVARGSAEHQGLRDNLAMNLDSLNEKEQEVFYEGYEQEQARKNDKTFYEYKTEEEKSKFNPVQMLQNTLWESFSHKESPLEPLTPFRPMAKFMHQRTATEDYIKTQIQGPDTAIWTKPVDHFIKPSQNRLISMISDGYKPEEVKEKERVDEFFDKLGLIKALKHGDINKAEKTVTGLTYSGIKDAKDMRNFKAALPDNQKPYMEAFSREKDRNKREEILKLVPDDIGRAYQSIWSNIDTYDQAKIKGRDPNQAVKEKYIADSKNLQSKMDINITSEERAGINSKAAAIKGGAERQQFIEEKEGDLVRIKAAEQEATKYIQNQIGAMPSNSWIGWDQRLTVDDIKLKTLTMGREDVQRYGYWNKDSQRNERIQAFDLDDSVVADLQLIKREMKDNRKQEHQISTKLRRFGFEVSNITTIPSNQRSIEIKDSQEYLENYNG